MKKIIYIIICVLSLLPAVADAQSVGKEVKAPSMFVFGVSCSLSDTVAYVTAVLPVENACVNSKTGFLYARNEYSYQYRDYLATEGIRNTMVAVTYNKKRTKLEKKYLKTLKKLEREGYLVKHVSADAFKFVGVEYSSPEEEE